MAGMSRLHHRRLQRNGGSPRAPGHGERGERKVMGSIWKSFLLQWSLVVCPLKLFALQGEMVQWTVFLISYWGDQIGQKVKKICDWWVQELDFFIAM